LVAGSAVRTIEIPDGRTKSDACEKILRTGERDADCPITGRIGGDDGPGGCDSWVVEVR